MMLNLDTNPGLRRLFLIARARVALGFLVALVSFWLARPTFTSLIWGGLIAALGEGLRVWASGHLRKGQEITCSGPYRFLHHPLYCGSLLIGFGFCIAAADTVAAALVISYLAVTLFVAVRLENATLREAFGQEFERYIQGTSVASTRKFSGKLMIANGEVKTLLGFVSTLGILALKAWFYSL